MNERILDLLKGDKSRYPLALEQKYPRIMDKIMELCDTPNIEPYFQELLVDNRGGKRHGFPIDVAADLITLSNLFARQHLSNFSGGSNVWGDIPEVKRHDLERLGYLFSADSFSKAVESGDEKAVRVFLSCGVDVNARDEREWTPLMISSFNGHEELAMLLIRCGARVQAEDLNGYTPLHWAAYNGYLPVVTLLISKGANVDARSRFGWTAMMQAATRGHTPVVTELLAQGADVNNKTVDGWTALHKAAVNGHSEIVLQLLEKGADRTAEYPEDNSTPLSLAESKQHDTIVRLLRNYRPIYTNQNSQAEPEVQPVKYTTP